MLPSMTMMMPMAMLVMTRRPMLMTVGCDVITDYDDGVVTMVMKTMLTTTTMIPLTHACVYNI